MRPQPEGWERYKHNGQYWDRYTLEIDGFSTTIEVDPEYRKSAQRLYPEDWRFVIFQDAFAQLNSQGHWINR
jgi:hypothetical protein